MNLRRNTDICSLAPATLVTAGKASCAAVVAALALIAMSPATLAQPTQAAPSGEGAGAPADANTANAPAADQAQAAPQEVYYIQEYRVGGAKLLQPIDIEKAVYPYLGPGRTAADVEAARAALEQAYRDKGFQTVLVQVPQQRVTNGIITLQVVEAPVGQLRVNNARYYLPSRIRRRAPSLTPGNIPNWEDVQRDIVALNRTADLRVTPSLSPGVVEGTVDIDLDVEDEFPLHGTLELNNRNTPNTTDLRINGSLSYSNLWQLGHTLGGSFQVAPERPEDATVFSAYYLLPVPNVETLSLLVQGTWQDSDISTLGTGVIGKGEVYSARALITLPAKERFYHNLALGIDYKSFEEDVTFGDEVFQTPITYYPLSALYTATWLGEKYETQFSGGINWHFRGLGSEPVDFDNKRFRADGGYIYFRGDLSHEHTLPADFQLLAKLQGQLADRPLINNEQYSGGGLSNARGYLESTVLGDNAIFGTFEFRSPSVFGAGDDKPNEWRFYGFVEGGILTLNDPLPEQDSRFELASAGVGTYIRLFDYLNGSLDLGFPLTDAGSTNAGDLLATFRLWAEF